MRIFRPYLRHLTQKHTLFKIRMNWEYSSFLLCFNAMAITICLRHHGITEVLSDGIYSVCIKHWTPSHSRSRTRTKYKKSNTLKGAMSRPAHLQDFDLLCWFSQLSAIFGLGNQADLWQQTSVYSTVLSDILFVYLSIFFVQFYCSYRREIMISDQATESVAVSFLRCWQGSFMNSCFSSTSCLSKELIVISTAYFWGKSHLVQM